MALKYQIIYWRDIPAQVKLKAGRQRLSKPLSSRFLVAIDEAAMQAGKTDSNDYLSEWRNGEWQNCEGEPETLLSKFVADLEADYPPERLRNLIQNKGLEGETS